MAEADCGGSEFSMVAELEDKLVVGKVINSLDDAYLLYCQYAHAKGFSVRKGNQRYFRGSNDLQAKEFECSREGDKDEKSSKDRFASYQKPDTRTQCKARLRVGREKDGDWIVTRFIIEHNHEMVDPDQTYLLRSSRCISISQKATLEAMVNAGISIANAVLYMEKEAQGPQNLRFTRKDAYNYLGSLKRHTKVEDGDASALLRYFIDKSNNEPFFYWNVQLDDDNRVMNFFFRDYRCRTDYEKFGDVLSVDTTYRTNRYNLICAPFVGINHHKQNVLFGLAFLSDETEISFEWLFRSFLESMNGKQPDSIFTDQCQAMMNAIDKVFVDSHHRLCQWHINQNAPSHFGSLNGDSNFKRTWHKCMSQCESAEEFEEIWRKMIEDYGLENHKWLNTMYKLRKRWSTAFSMNRFCAGLQATSRSEGTNSMLKRAGDRTSTLHDFVLNYENVQDKWREKEKVEDTRCHQGKPAMIMKNHPMLNQVAQFYTFNIYSMFELEMVDSLATIIVHTGLSNSDGYTDFIVKSLNEDSRSRKVIYNRIRNYVFCSCHKFEIVGILCKHALKVLNHMHIQILPEVYIKTRWMKRAGNRSFNLDTSTKLGNESEMCFVNQIMRSMYDLAVRCKVNKEAQKMLSRVMDFANEQANLICENVIAGQTDLGASMNIPINLQMPDVEMRNPVCVMSKGRTNARILRHWDDKSKKGKRKKSTGDNVGSKARVLESSSNQP